MLEQRYRWKNKQLREHVAVIDGAKAPTMLLKNATYLNQTFRKWMKANIWIYGDRIVYVGEALPSNLKETEVVNCEDYFLVPGYIEPHVHPFQLYNPHSFAKYAGERGTTTLVNDNMLLALQLDKKKAFSLLREMRTIPSTMYWWCRLDPQTEIINEEVAFSHGNVKAWLEHDAVLQAGELTGWPKLLDGDDLMLHWIQEAKRMRKQVEGHFPGASPKTLAKLMLLGADSDHESMSGRDVYERLLHGYTVTLRYSSIRPDLPRIVRELAEMDITCFDKMMMTTDGSPPAFYEDGVSDKLIKLAIESGVPLVDAYNMATVNVARFYNIEYLHGNIMTGRVANINFLKAKDEPTPVSVLAKGKWILRDEEQTSNFKDIEWSDYGFQPLSLDWNLTMDDLQFSMPLGLKLENAVIMKPYSITFDVSRDEISTENDESFLMLMDREGKWRINTLIKGFSTHVSGFASSFSSTGDIVLLGKNKLDMIAAFNRMKEIGGGIVLAEDGEIVTEIPLKLNGLMSEKPLSALQEEEKMMREALVERGYEHCDPIYTLLFLSSTHLPYIRLTPRGLYDVMNKNILFPTVMR
ncbi:adenine deaminase [Priestia filamentosa]|uniref:adenine deaminase C-terminal domain-containing protein n=1 Tax=Priestia filamentosa TaxID=1402861 RepID=UPI001FB1E16A|nr:adenine deaminase C-terminal domain-containing protein [Priestia filamentosa]MED3727818.1 adenine deaminase C-terminal domain-containing protein [Priestia filamentosa]UOE60306.1 adenine deaminase [Priestia filamentosa]